MAIYLSCKIHIKYSWEMLWKKEIQMMRIHLLSFEGKKLGDHESNPDGEADNDVQQKVSPPL